jgi:hypothetical protein
MRFCCSALAIALSAPASQVSGMVETSRPS